MANKAVIVRVADQGEKQSFIRAWKPLLPGPGLNVRVHGISGEVVILQNIRVALSPLSARDSGSFIRIWRCLLQGNKLIIN